MFNEKNKKVVGKKPLFNDYVFTLKRDWIKYVAGEPHSAENVKLTINKPTDLLPEEVERQMAPFRNGNAQARRTGETIEECAARFYREVASLPVRQSWEDENMYLKRMYSFEPPPEVNRVFMTGVADTIHELSGATEIRLRSNYEEFEPVEMSEGECC